MNDPIADLLVRLRNSQLARREKVSVPHSNIKAKVLEILKREGAIVGFSEKQVRGKKFFEITLEATTKSDVLPEFVRASKPGRRVYVKAKDIPRPLRGYGLVVLSTPQGVMTGREARRKGVGGEVLFWER